MESVSTGINLHIFKKITPLYLCVFVLAVGCLWSFLKIKIQQKNYNLLSETVKTHEAHIRTQQTEVDSLYAKLYRLNYKLFVNEINSIKGSVDLSVSSIQEIGDGFDVCELQAEEHLTGIKIQ